MSRPIIARMQRYHRHRWFFYAAWGWATIAVVYFATGYAGTIAQFVYQAIDRPNPYEVQSWAEYPVATFLHIDRWVFGVPHTLVGNVTTWCLHVSTLAVLFAGAALVAGRIGSRTKVAELSTASFVTAQCLSLPLGLVSLWLVEFLLVIVRVETELPAWLDWPRSPFVLLSVVLLAWQGWCFIIGRSLASVPYPLAVAAWIEQGLAMTAIAMFPLFCCAPMDRIAQTIDGRVPIGMLISTYWLLTCQVVLLHSWRQWGWAFCDATHCLVCDYDLTGTRAAGRVVCPECGATCGIVSSTEP
ncbi:MAG: hypothetical protein WD042_07045 [Phycisphaeraceae bacterium]